MATTISFNYEDKPYVLEYDRASVIALEKKGFNIIKAEESPITTLYLLWEGAFEKHHSNVSIQKRDEILKVLEKKSNLLETLVLMYSEPIQMLADTDDSKKVKWELNKG